ncbi:hypothetical protein JTB14_015090 [Gonioctena quinquepunctata]|nr:hypothetical protein JTB14_015090 [Gonioctena quinquepunctata]
MSAIVSKICSPAVAPDFQWETLDDHAIEHIPIMINCANRFIHQYKPVRWKLELADWDKYATLVGNYQPTTNGAYSMVEDVSFAILSAASEYIPRSNAHTSRRNIPW